MDSLGGDNAPWEIVAGSIAAATRLPNDEFFLIGDEAALAAELNNAPANIFLRHASGVVSMGEEPAVALRRRPDSSVAVAAGMVRAG
ncbi:MAG: phosphate acyltransferase, partial [Rubrobacter sp.]|nr:phosphate acyltransferase [Rubrobacter sp.]